MKENQSDNSVVDLNYILCGGTKRKIDLKYIDGFFINMRGEKLPHRSYSITEPIHLMKGETICFFANSEKDTVSVISQVVDNSYKGLVISSGTMRYYSYIADRNLDVVLSVKTELKPVSVDIKKGISDDLKLIHSIEGRIPKGKIYKGYQFDTNKVFPLTNYGYLYTDKTLHGNNPDGSNSGGYRWGKIDVGKIKSLRFSNDFNTPTCLGFFKDDTITPASCIELITAAKDIYHVPQGAKYMVLSIWAGDIKNSYITIVDCEQDNIVVSSQLKPLQDEINNIKNNADKHEIWSNLPVLNENPLQIISDDYPFAHIFRDWGFIGDSLSSGEMYGYGDPLDVIITDKYTGKIIDATGQLIECPNGHVSNVITIDGYNPTLQVLFDKLPQSYTSGVAVMCTCDELGNNIKVQSVLSSELKYRRSAYGLKYWIISYIGDVAPRVRKCVTKVEDMYEYSWGQYLCRSTGAKGFNYSVGGEYCKRWLQGNDNQRRLAQAKKTPHQAYIISLGTNDEYLFKSNYADCNYPAGNALTDIDLNNKENNSYTYAGLYGKIIQELLEIQPMAKIFCVARPVKDSNNAWIQAVLDMEKVFERTPKQVFVIDLNKYQPKDSQLADFIDLNGHHSAIGYRYRSMQIGTYINWLCRKYYDDMRDVSWIGKGVVAKNPLL